MYINYILKKEVEKGWTSNKDYFSLHFTSLSLTDLIKKNGLLYSRLYYYSVSRNFFTKYTTLISPFSYIIFLNDLEKSNVL